MGLRETTARKAEKRSNPRDAMPQAGVTSLCTGPVRKRPHAARVIYRGECTLKCDAIADTSRARSKAVLQPDALTGAHFNACNERRR